VLLESYLATRRIEEKKFKQILQPIMPKVRVETLWKMWKIKIWNCSC